MSRVIVVPGADASGRGLPPVSLATIDREIGRVPGLVNFLDPAVVPGAVVNGAVVNDVLATAFKDRVRGRPLRAVAPYAPKTFANASLANGRPLFDMRSIGDSNLGAQDATFTASLTMIMLIVPAATSIDGSKNSFLLRVFDPVATASRFSFYSNTSATPVLLLREDTQGFARQWIFGSALAVNRPAVLALTIDADAKQWALYHNTGQAPVITHSPANVTAYPNARYTFFGSRAATAGWAGLCGRTAIWNRALTAAERVAMMDQWRDFYGITV